jgi:nitrite reductase/ring-hydroxylating ferredoxin subunit
VARVENYVGGFRLGVRMALHKVATIHDPPPGGGRAVQVAGRSIAIFNVEGTIHAIDNDCTHDGAPLSEGAVEDGCVVCPWHGAQFDLTSGKALTPPAVEDVQSYRIVMSGEDILIEIE